MQTQISPRQTKGLSLPEILTANTYWWIPANNASNRRRNEERHLANVEAFFQKLGFETSIVGNYVNAELGQVQISFYYAESCKNVYKSLTIINNGRKSNITTLKKLM